MCGSRLSSGRRGSILGQILKKLLEGLRGAGLGEGVQDHITAFTLKGQRTGRSCCYHCGHCHYICSCASVGNGLRRESVHKSTHTYKRWLYDTRFMNGVQFVKAAPYC